MDTAVENTAVYNVRGRANLYLWVELAYRQHRSPLIIRRARDAGAHHEACNSADSTKKTATYTRTRLLAPHDLC